MKKFRFSLETVLDYKQQVLASLQTEHGAILGQVRDQEQFLEALEAEYRHMDHEFTRHKLSGVSILDAMKYEQYLRSMERQIQEETAYLEELRRKEEAKRQQVVEARQESSAIEKLREKKLESYNKAVQKGEEAMIDELVSTKRVMAAQSA